jgi:glycosyltransferase involved in cell wall biosynthesis
MALCVCPAAPVIDNKVAVLVLQHPQEQDRVLGTARMVERCLASVAWADEIVVVDSGSSDATVEIARRLRAKVETTADWPGFGPQKNRALALATGDWVLSLDADEWVTPELRAEIERAIGAPDFLPAYRMPRLSSYCGRDMRHSGWWPDHVTRLFRRGDARFSDDLVHERLVVNGVTGTLREPLRHEAIRDLDRADLAAAHPGLVGDGHLNARGDANLQGAADNGGQQGGRLCGDLHRHIKALLAEEARVLGDQGH